MSLWYVALGVLNGMLIVVTLLHLTPGSDFAVLDRAGRLAGEPELYDRMGALTFIWSPVAAYPLQLVAVLGIQLWRIILAACAMAMPEMRLKLIVLASWPFWIDFATGNLMTLIFLASVWAMRGSRIATFAFFCFALLIPRPLLAPMAVWILWKRTEWRWPFAGMFVIHVLLVWWTGLAPEWIHTLLTTGTALQSFELNLSPTRIIGYWWLAVGVPLGAWLLWRGRLGWSGLVLSPYVWIYYLYWALPEVNRFGSPTPSPSNSSAAAVR